MKNNNSPYWLLAAIVVIYLFAALVDPCDGHSCDAEVVDAR